MSNNTPGRTGANLLAVDFEAILRDAAAEAAANDNRANAPEAIYQALCIGFQSFGELCRLSELAPHSAMRPQSPHIGNGRAAAIDAFVHAFQCITALRTEG